MPGIENLTAFVYLAAGVIIGVATCYLLMRLDLMKTVDKKLTRNRKYTKNVNEATLLTLGQTAHAFSEQVHFVDQKCDGAVAVCVEAFEEKKTELIAITRESIGAITTQAMREADPKNRHTVTMSKTLESIRKRSEDRIISELAEEKKQKAAAGTN